MQPQSETAAPNSREIDERFEVFNPNNRPVEDLPVIFGFNNGGNPGWLMAELIAEDGEPMGGHICSHEAYMYGDLGILKGHRADRHEGFRAKYPDGYRMDFVTNEEVKAKSCPDFEAVWPRHEAKYLREGQSELQVAE